LQFQYSNLRANSSRIQSCDTVAVSIDVTNVGEVDSDETVQVKPRLQCQCTHRRRHPSSCLCVDVFVVVSLGVCFDCFFDVSLGVSFGCFV
jgi:hypothetical protein